MYPPNEIVGSMNILTMNLTPELYLYDRAQEFL